jgi:hypothetical protein
VQARRGKTNEALVSLESAHVNAHQAADTSQGAPAAQERLVRVATDYAEQLIQANRPREALRMLGAARGRLDRLLSEDSLNTRHKADLIYGFNMESAALEQLGDRPAAISAGGRALALAEAALAAEPTDVGMHIAVLLTRYPLGVLQLRAGNSARGIDQLREAIRTGQHILAIAPQHGFVKHQVASAQLELGEALLAAARVGEGCHALGAGLTGWRDAAAVRRLPGESAAALPRFERLFAQCTARGPAERH